MFWGLQEYWLMKERIVDSEQLILRVLGFDVETFQAYRYLISIYIWSHVNTYIYFYISVSIV